jgi:hydroxymethylpyrimidine/phosphomethylpyrimidine kinase
MGHPHVVLSVAGYDPSSGAGITADIKTAAANGCFAITCITALTVQSTQGVFGVQAVDAGVVAQTLRRLAEDFEVAAVRIGMLGSGELAAVLADFLEGRRLPHVVLDPVINSSSGTALLDQPGLEVLRTRLIPLCEVMTPNVDEAATLTGVEPPHGETTWEVVRPRVEEMAERLRRMRAGGVLITGGNLRPPHDYLSYGTSKRPAEVIEGEFLPSGSTHGTGCAFAMALACQLARGLDLSHAARAAKAYVRGAILAAYPLGKGVGPVNHFT